MITDMLLPVSLFTSGTIVNVDFPYEEDERVKHRPAIVFNFDDNITRVILLKVTSKEPKTEYDYSIINYEDTGLTKKPSVVKCNCVYTVANDTKLQKIGNLSRHDLINVTILFNQAYSNKNIIYY